jgi:putative transposase
MQQHADGIAPDQARMLQNRPSVLSSPHYNALAETINGLYKAELIHRRAPWKTKEAVEFATLEWVAWFNNHRLLEPIGYIPPAEAEANYYRQLAAQPMAMAA